RQGREVELYLGEGEKTHCRDDIMNKRQRRRDRKVPFEAKGDVEADSEERQYRCHHPRPAQFFSNPRPNEFGTPILCHLVAQFGANRVYSGHLLAFGAWLALQVDQDVVCLTKLLERDGAETQAAQTTAEIFEICRFMGANFYKD